MQQDARRKNLTLKPGELQRRRLDAGYESLAAFGRAVTEAMPVDPKRGRRPRVVTRAHVANWERRHGINAVYLRVVCMVLNCQVEDLAV